MSQYIPIYRMTRTGEFKRSKDSPNQCKVKGQVDYTYTLTMVFDQKLKLDKDGFIIDHADIDAKVHKLKFIGSCEEMHVILWNAIKELMDEKRIPLRAYKAIIKPKPEGVAFMEYIWAAGPRYGKYLP